jgi:hypothetical protein
MISATLNRTASIWSLATLIGQNFNQIDQLPSGAKLRALSQLAALTEWTVVDIQNTGSRLDSIPLIAGISDINQALRFINDNLDQIESLCRKIEYLILVFVRLG